MLIGFLITGQMINIPIDKVFSELLQRCRKGTEIYNLREKFYNMFKNKEDIKYGGGFYLSNGIINFKKGKPRHLLQNRRLKFH